MDIAEDSRLQAKLVKQRGEIARLTKVVEQLTAEKAALRLDLVRMREAINS